MRCNIEQAIFTGNLLLNGNTYGMNTVTLAANFTMSTDMPQLQFLNPNGTPRNVLLPAVKRGHWFCVVNTDPAGSALTVKDSTNTTVIGVVAGNGVSFFFSDGVTWWNFGAPGGTSAFVSSGSVAPASYSTAGAQTYTAADVVGGIISRDPNGASRSDVWPTAALLVAATPNAQVGDVISTLLVNGADAAETVTIGAGAGGGFDANQTASSRLIGQNASKLIRTRLTNVTPAAEAYVIYC